jgi:GGDEF domain-containing protein
MKHVKFLLSGISSTAVDTDTRPAFQQQVNTISADLPDQPEDAALSAQLASVVKLLDEYNRAAEHKTQAQQRELRGIITATTDTIAAISSSSKTGVEQMRSLESNLENASKVDDLKLLRHKLFACLTLVRNEAVRMQMDSQMLIRSLSASVLRASSELSPGTDATTGLPSVTTLQKDMDAAAGTGQATAMAILILTDLATFNARYGRPVGDEVLRLATEYVREQFADLAQVYRGHGPSLILVCNGSNANFEQFEQKARQMIRYPFQASILADGKMRNINVALSGTYHRLTPNEKIEDIFRKFDAFASRQLETV